MSLFVVSVDIHRICGVPQGGQTAENVCTFFKEASFELEDLNFCESSRWIIAGLWLKNAPLIHEIILVKRVDILEFFSSVFLK